MAKNLIQEKHHGVNSQAFRSPRAARDVPSQHLLRSLMDICLAQVQFEAERQSLRCRGPRGIGIDREGPTEETFVASFAAKWSDKEQCQNHRFHGSFTFGLVDSRASAVWAVDHCDSPEAARRSLNYCPTPSELLAVHLCTRSRQWYRSFD